MNNTQIRALAIKEARLEFYEAVRGFWNRLHVDNFSPVTTKEQLEQLIQLCDQVNTVENGRQEVT